MKKTVLVLGAGYGGLMTAVKLEAKSKDRDDLDIVLVDKNPYHQYVHLSYEIVTNVKKVSDLTLPLAELLKNKKIQVMQATVTEIDVKNKIVKTDKGDLSYFKVVIALGNEPNFYGIKGVSEFAMPFNSVESASKIRDKVLQFISEKKRFNVVVGGGGFTGVELVGEILDESHCCVTIIEANENLLPSWNNVEFSKKVASVLTSMGADLMLGKRIVEVKPHQVVLSDGSIIESSIFVWTAGVSASSVVSKSGLKTGKGGRAVINEFCEAVGFPGVYVVGDSALTVDPNTGEILPQCVEIALQQAEVVAANIHADLNKSPKPVYRPKFSGLVLAVGEIYGIGKIYGVTVEGKIAQTLKRLIHLQYVYEIAGLPEVIKEAI